MPDRRRLFIAPSAAYDLEKIWLHIADDNPSAARRQVSRILSAADNLRDFPEMGKVRNRLASGLRSLIEDPYVIFYYPHPARIEIVRVFHGRQDIESEMISFVRRYFPPS